MSTAVADLSAWQEALDSAPRSGGLPPWLQALKHDAHERFLATGFPAGTDERYRFTNLGPIASTSFARGSRGAAVDPAALPSLDTERGPLPRVVVVNGRLRRELSAAPPRGVRVMDLAEALPLVGPALEERLGRVADAASNPFVALNTALCSDVVVVLVEPRAVVGQPLHLCFAATANGGPTRSHPRLLVLADRGSQAVLVTSFVGVGAERLLSNSVIEVSLDEGAVLDLVRDQRLGGESFDVSQVAVRQARDSRFRDFSLNLGGRLVRHDVAVRLEAEGAECELAGLFAPTASQLMDTHSYVDHAAPHTVSRELYKGVLAGEARGVFNGHVLVRPDAQKIDAEQTNRNLLLSRKALVNSTPALEIRADDVKCRHGSTTGELDEAAVFYLRSRGLDETEARAILTRAFAGEVVQRLPVEALRTVAEAHVDRLVAGVSA